MVSGYEALKEDLVAASDSVLALRGITNPTEQQRCGALLDAEFKLRVIGFLTKR